MKNRRNCLKRRVKLRRLVNEGFVFETCYVCDICGAMLYDIPGYDAKGCLACDTWADDVCGDPECPVCSRRPATPWGIDFESRRITGHAVMRKNYLRDNYFHKKNGAERREKRLEYIKTHRKR